MPAPEGVYSPANSLALSATIGQTIEALCPGAYWAPRIFTDGTEALISCWRTIVGPGCACSSNASRPPKTGADCAALMRRSCVAGVLNRRRLGETLNTLSSGAFLVAHLRDGAREGGEALLESLLSQTGEVVRACASALPRGLLAVLRLVGGQAHQRGQRASMNQARRKPRRYAAQVGEVVEEDLHAQLCVRGPRPRVICAKLAFGREVAQGSLQASAHAQAPLSFSCVMGYDIQSCVMQSERAFVSAVPQPPHKKGRSRIASFHNASQIVTLKLFACANGLRCTRSVELACSRWLTMEQMHVSKLEPRCAPATKWCIQKH